MNDPFLPGDDVFERLHPTDGFHIVDIHTDNSVALYCQAIGEGQLVNLTSDKPDDATVLLRRWQDPTEEQRGEAERLRYVLDAIARYLTTGGSWEDLAEAMQKMRTVALGPVELPGYYLRELVITSEGSYQYTFYHRFEPEKAVLWEAPDYTEAGGVVDGIIDITTREALQAQEDGDAEAGSGRGYEGQTRRPQLPDRSDS